ncbi:MAG TPA: YbhB/YbcL family Raf kinase inhibitor-like protein [Anaerolineales bacterium]
MSDPKRKLLSLPVFVLLALLAACGSGASAPAPTASTDNSPAQTEAAAPTEAEAEEAATEEPASASSDFILSSPVMEDGGRLPVTYTCEDQGVSPPLAWQGAPSGTMGYALEMHHVAGADDIHWYWLVYDIPAETQSITAGQADFGTFGTNSVDPNLAYAAPCSQGPGDKLYTITVYALSAPPDLSDPASVDREALLAAIEALTLAEASMDVTFDRDNP